MAQVAWSCLRPGHGSSRGSRPTAVSDVRPVGGVPVRRLALIATLALAVWASALPFILLLVVPQAGLRTAIPIALALLVGISLACWALSVPARARRPVGGGKN